jgi:uncharacterized protein (DUF58 family)
VNALPIAIAPLLASCRLVLPRRARGAAGGAVSGLATGSSLEFEDRRPYAAGDDPRHIDWSAYARTDQLQIRLYREEVTPRLELLVDVSRSMAIGEDKATRVRELTAAFAGLAVAGGLELRVFTLGDELRAIAPEAASLGEIGFEARTPLQVALDSALPRLRHGALRLLVSDFLSPHDARNLVLPLARGGPAALVQVLGRDDVEIEEGAALLVIDVENDETVEVELDAAAVARYRERLAGLRGALAAQARATGATFASLLATDPLLPVARDALLEAGILAPR